MIAGGILKRENAVENDCPFCHKPCPIYDQHSSVPHTWRGLDAGGVLVEAEYRTHRINCPEHGIYVADVPWAYPGSGFTKDFDLTAAWLATYLPRSVVSQYLRIDWETVGRCVNRALNDIIRKAYGFRNIQNMLDMVYLVCSDLKVPLPNRKPKAA